MTFIIPKGGKMVNIGKQLLKLKEGEYTTSDKDMEKALQLAKGVTKKEAAKKAS